MTTAAARDDSMSRWQRAVLPAVEGGAAGGPQLRRSIRDWLVDVVIFVFAVALGGADLHTHLGSASVPLRVIDVTLAVAACLSLWMRRRHPLAVGLFCVGASAISGGAGGAAVAAIFTVAVHCPPRWTARVAALSAISAAISAAVYPSAHRFDAGGLEVGLVFTIMAVGYGLYVRARRELVLSLHERNRRLEAEQDLRVREARHAERTRIAREMHDVLAHRISLLSVHAGALEYNPSASPDEIARAAGVIRTSARAAQEELRAVIGVLRDDGGVQEGLPPPQPTLTDVPALIAESRRAGMEVSCEVTSRAGELPAPLGRTVYRLVQEGLTNARKHAPGQPVTITITGEPGGELIVEVVNRARVGQRRAVAEGEGSGTGLVGLAERVALGGGELSHEPLRDGGFRMRAALPWT